MCLFPFQNSMEQLVPVRVIRGHKFRDTYPRKVYTYDGLYMVDILDVSFESVLFIMIFLMV